VERDDRPAVATFFADAAPIVGGVTTLGEDAAHHARVKRIDVGDIVQLTDGRGSMARGSVSALRRGALEVVVDATNELPRPPALHLCVPVADRDRMLWLAEKAAEFGVATWRAVRFRRSMSVSPRGEGTAFSAKIRARMLGALEQSGGAWLPEILPDAPIETLAFAEGVFPIVLDIMGAPILSLLDATGPTKPPMIIFGPEGGIERDELVTLEDRGWRTARLSRNTLRFETAGIAAVGVVRAAQQREEP
jgi:16S rRNA (uracil1498-N3)-methyltransferase